MSRIHYRIRPYSPEAHLFDVLLTLTSPTQNKIILRLPAWIPGSYMIREFSRNIVEIHAVWKNGTRSTPVPICKEDKHTWVINTPEGFSYQDAVVWVRYTVYAWDLSVRAAHLDTSHGFFNGSSVFLAVEGQEKTIHELEIVRPADQEYMTWQAFTTLEKSIHGVPSEHSLGLYQAQSYDELIDHPVEMGCPLVLDFDVLNIPHQIIITGAVTHLDRARLINDVQLICEQQAALFEPEQPSLPFKQYKFFILTTHQGYGGLEHRSSTVLLCHRHDFPVLGQSQYSEGYRSLLGLISHEYFHNWLIKRIKPSAFIPYDLTRENYTRLLWIFEGFTSYYDDLMLLRSGRINIQDYLKIIANNLHTVTKSSGRLKQSVEDSSFDAWIKYYRQDENSPNAIVSYYAKGALIALGLDIQLRQISQGVLALDNILRHLWQKLGKTAYTDHEIGLNEGNGNGSFFDYVQQTINEAIQSGHISKRHGISFLKWLAIYLKDCVSHTQDVPIEPLLSKIGLEFNEGTLTESLPYLGWQTKVNGSFLEVKNTFDGGAAQQAGIASGDILLALDAIRIQPADFNILLKRYAPGDIVTVHLFRLDVLHQFTVRLQPPPTPTKTLTLRKGKWSIRDQWLKND